MKQTVNEYDFRRAFEASRPDNFSYEGLGLLFEYFEQLEDDMGEEIELDVIAICCEWAESTCDDIIQDFGLNDVIPGLADMEGADQQIAVYDYLNEQTMVAGETKQNTIVYQSY